VSQIDNSKAQHFEGVATQSVTSTAAHHRTQPEPMVSPPGMALLVFIAIVLMLAAIEVLFRGTIYERPKSTPNFLNTRVVTNTK